MGVGVAVHSAAGYCSCDFFHSWTRVGVLSIHHDLCLLFNFFPGAFDLLAYTNRDQDIPETWEESQARIIANSEEVRLRSFSTTVHKVDTMVSYKAED